ncbi:antibiotic biosynthesis monooxygenase family protein [Rhizobium sp.]|jgi:heme-degrading monooxygenase HmoA|uniref:antibiotic biosynthesis monooxygenase family protein n=1 Tax=Rhizobium sp. TaxID=391 RepID=UPI000E96082C|nr:antibiotic biosynthesis monooxygenase [Rhizobium sp.]
MIVEIASILVKPGHDELFEAAIKQAVDVLKRAEGCHGVQLQRCIETPELYQVHIRWRSVDDHMTGFRNSPLFQEWRALIGPHFASPPTVQHFEYTTESFTF